MARATSDADDALLARADGLWDRGERQAALDLCARVVKRSPRSAEARFRWGTLLASGGRLLDGITQLEQAIALNPNAVGAHHNLGNAYREAERLDEAEACFRAVIAGSPSLAAGFHGLGQVLRARGDLDGAAAAYRRAVGLDADFAPGWTALAEMQELRGRPAEAIASFTRAHGLDRAPSTLRRLAVLHALHGTPSTAAALLRQVLRSDPGDALVGHLLAAIDGSAVARPPDGFVVELFDRYAATFDAHLTGSLGYRAPGLVIEALDAVRPGVRFERAVDLGCGTGLAGALVRARCPTLIGVDLSPAMLERARARGVYDELVCAELEAFLHASDLRFDLFLAVDVLGYVGALDGLFAAVRARATDHAAIVFTTEVPPDGEGLHLGRTGRYAHSAGCVDEAARSAGLSVVHRTREILRTEADRPVVGDVTVLAPL
jgi:predicted TPR repeat methyltransferase